MPGVRSAQILARASVLRVRPRLIEMALEERNLDTPHGARTRWPIGWTVLVLICGRIVIGFAHFSLSALQEPGPVETRVANAAKHFLIRMASREGIPQRPLDAKASIEAGATHYGLECSTCHGVDGHAQTPPGRWMYPRAADLTSKQVQSYSDRELFWIIKNGIRFTGMPGFGKLESPNHVWDLVNYVRTLPRTK